MAGLRSTFLVILILFGLSLFSTNVNAHDGPPFALMVDQMVGQMKVSVWTDPDVGTGTFFVILEPQNGVSVPNDLRVEVAVQPASGRLKEAIYPANKQDLRGQIQYKALVSFDAQEYWRVRILLHSGQANGELTGTVEATPPGLGRWDLLIYLMPFLAVGVLWFLAVKRRRFRKVQS
jgi:hypothetical protein